MRTILSRVGVFSVPLLAGMVGLLVLFGVGNGEALSLPSLMYVAPPAVVAILAAWFSLFLLWRGGWDRPTVLVAILVPAVPMFLSGLAGLGEAGYPDESWLASYLEITLVVSPWLTLCAFLLLSVVFPVSLTPAEVPYTSVREALRHRQPFSVPAYLQALALRPTEMLILMGTAAGLTLLISTLAAVVEINAESSIFVPLVQVLTMGVGVLCLFLLFLQGWVAGYRNLRIGYQRAEPPDRLKTGWAVHGLMTALWLGAFFVGCGFVRSFPLEAHADEPWLVAVAYFYRTLFFGGVPLAVLGGFAMAIFYRGALDPGLAMARTTLWGLSSFLFLMCFSTLDTLISEALEVRIPVPGVTSALLAGVGSGALLWPFRRLLSRLSERTSERVLGQKETG